MLLLCIAFGSSFLVPYGSFFTPRASWSISLKELLLLFFVRHYKFVLNRT